MLNRTETLDCNRNQIEKNNLKKNGQNRKTKNPNVLFGYYCHNGDNDDDDYRVVMLTKIMIMIMLKKFLAFIHSHFKIYFWSNSFQIILPLH